MLNRRSGCIPATLILSIIAMSSSANTSERIAVHPSNMRCPGCHVSAEFSSEDNAVLLRDSEQELCGKCHIGIMQVSHPSGVESSMKFPANLPAGTNNSLTCSTCHDLHRDTDNFLRTEKQGLQFCYQCHDEEFFTTMKDHGMSLLTSTHLNTGKNDRTESVNDSRVPTPDYLSLQCLSCHEDSGRTYYDNVFNDTFTHGGTNANHRIGVYYASYQDYGGYIPETSIADGIILPEGKLSCISCHQGFSKEHGSLVMSNSGSALCYSCHEI